jgi:hypothetical protein
MNQNVMIPLSLLDQIVELLQVFDLSKYDPAFRYDYNKILYALMVKKQKLDLRDAYAKIIQTNNPDDRFEARIRYLQQKKALADVIDPPF